MDYEYNSEEKTVKTNEGKNYNTKNNLCGSKTYKLYNGKEG